MRIGYSRDYTVHVIKPDEIWGIRSLCDTFTGDEMMEIIPENSPDVKCNCQECLNKLKQKIN